MSRWAVAVAEVPVDPNSTIWPEEAEWHRSAHHWEAAAGAG